MASGVSIAQCKSGGVPNGKRLLVFDEQYVGLLDDMSGVFKRFQIELQTCVERWVSSCHEVSQVELSCPTLPLPLRATASADCVPPIVHAPLVAWQEGNTQETKGAVTCDTVQTRVCPMTIQTSTSSMLCEFTDRGEVQGSYASENKCTSSRPPSLTCSRTHVTLLGRGSTPVHQKVSLTSHSARRTRFRRHQSPMLKTRESIGTTSGVFQIVTKSAAYDVFKVVSIFANAVFVAWETERRAMIAEDNPISDAAVRGEVLYNVVSDVFCGLFLFDFALRMLADKGGFFLTRNWLWNVFDVACVSTAVVESVARWHQYATSELNDFRAFAGKFAALRIIRVLRVVRSTRAIRLSQLTREFAIMVYSLASAVKPLLWSVALVCVVLFMFGVFFTDGTITVLVQSGGQGKTAPSTTMLKFFSRFPRGALSLYMVMAGGVDWHEIWDALQTMPLDYRVMFLVFLTFSILALLNVITAVFVQAVLSSAQKDSEMLIQQEVERKAEFVANLQRLFDEIDTNGSGTLSLDEFERQMEDENVLNFMSTLDLDIDNVKTLLTLLDRDQNEQVDIHEFLQGCLRLKGDAKNLDMAILQYQIEWILHNVARLSAVVSGPGYAFDVERLLPDLPNQYSSEPLVCV